MPLLFIIFIQTSLLLLQTAHALTPASELAKRTVAKSSNCDPGPIGPTHTLILTRHGDSLWNGKYPGCQETFTGWTDVDLSPIGKQEAIRTGQLLTQYTSGINIDALFTSTLTRAKMTAHECWWAYNSRLEEQYSHQKSYQYYNYNNPTNQQNQQLRKVNDNQHQRQYQTPAKYIIDHRLNERHYGSLQGLIKSDTELGLHGHSPQDVYEWRRSWHAVPPPLEDDDPRRQEELRIYRNLCGENNVPRSESLAMVAENRIRPFLEESLTPLLENAYQSKSLSMASSMPEGLNNGEREMTGSTALVVAHANSLRALIGVLCNVENDPSGVALSKLESMKIPTGSPLVIRFRKTKEVGRYFPVDSALGTELQNDLAVYPLSSLPLLRQQTNYVISK